MKPLTKVLAFGILILLSVSGTWAAEEKIGPSWEKILQCTISHSVNSIGFFNNTSGMSVGYSGECHYTTDGGKTWPRAENQSYCLYGLQIFNEENAWSCGNNGMVRVTNDGGNTWQEKTNCGFVSQFISFVDTKTGWVAGGRNLAITRDGGITWNRLPVPSGIHSINGMTLVTEQNGYLLDLDQGGTVAVTRDGGQTWITQKVGIPGTTFTNVTGAPTATMGFTDENHGMIVTCLLEQKIEAAFLTADGGKTWNMEKVSIKIGYPSLTRNGKYLTILSPDNVVSLWVRK
jgi:photosystem II stability/assembly factor-like uncharacterized protein